MELIKEIKLENNVDYALEQSVRELLPREIRENKLALWIMNFSGLGDSNKDNIYQKLDIDSILNIISDFSRKEKREVSFDQKFPEKSLPNRENLLEDIFNTIIPNSLIPNITFYFSSLFHIGREWQVSQQAVETTVQALKEKNLAETVEQNFLILQDELIKLDIPETEHKSYLKEAFTGILETAQKQHSANLELSQKWWKTWKQEVGDFQRIFATFDERIESNRNREFYKDKDYYYKGTKWESSFSSVIQFITFSFQAKSLYQEFLKAGVKFKGINLSGQTQKSLILNSLTYLCLFLAMTNEKDFFENNREVFMEFQEIIYQLQKLQREERYTPLVQEVEKQLLREFQEENPFEKYGVLKSLPDRSLLDLWNKCKLPNGKRFYYAQNWLDSLESELRGYTELPFISELKDENIESYARAIDSNIKRQWVEITSSDKVGRSDTDLIQYLFEQKCIIQLVNGAVYPSRENKGQQKWNVDNFREMMEKVVQFLNELGYNLEAPSKTRLEMLWDSAIKKYIYESDF